MLFHMRFRKFHTWPRFFRATVAAQIHFLGLLTAVASFIVFSFSPHINGEHFYACAGFSILGALVMAVSATYHFLHDGFVITKKLAARFEKLDHFAIYLFIAGTYTPFLLNSVHSAWQGPMIIAIWSTALAGIAYTLAKPRLPSWAQSRAVYTGFFVMMGWLMLVRVSEIAANLSASSLTLLLSGAAAYTLGAVSYATKKPRLFPNLFGYHEIWHIAVLAGFAFHFAMILLSFTARDVRSLRAKKKGASKGALTVTSRHPVGDGGLSS
jgi:hemolysin III